jgi:hypothetical protein
VSIMFKAKPLKAIKTPIVIALLNIHVLMAQEWASMAYTISENDASIFSGLFKSTSQVDIILGLDCEDQVCVYKMTPKEFIKSMELLGWELSEHIQSKDKKGQHVVWFRRYE